MRNSSKGFAPFLVILLFAVFAVVAYFGYKYLKPTSVPTKQLTISTPTAVPSNKLKIGTVSSPTPQTTKCGEIPSNIEVQSDHYTIVKGPMWALDCKHIAWSSWQSTFANPSIPVGLFIYNVSSKTSSKVYSPKQGQDEEDVELKYWQDINSVVFIKDGQGALYLYDLTTNKVTLK